MQLFDPPDAHVFLERTPAALFVDCRSEVGHLFVGHPADAHRVSWNNGPHREVNPKFMSTVCKLTGHGTECPVALICWSGNHLAAVAHALREAGFHGIYIVRHGFEGDLDNTRHHSTFSGWRHTDLPWEQC